MDRHSRHSRFIAYLGFLLFSLGFIKPVSAAMAPVQEFTAPSQPEVPIRIVIPTVDINLNVQSVKIVNGTWVVSESSATYGLESSPLNAQKGSSIIFAHAKDGIFATLSKSKLTDEITILGTENIYTYKIISIQKIFPGDVQKIVNSNADLNLLTCAGDDDEYRLFVQANLSSTLALDSREVT